MVINLPGTIKGIPLEHFSDIPLDVRRRAWALFSAMPRRENSNATCRWASLPQLPAPKICCPWGAVLVAIDQEKAAKLRYLRPNDMQIPPVVHELSGFTIAVNRDWDEIEDFTKLSDMGSFTEEEVHRLMVPEDYAEATNG
jgi:hypothetical protein